ncbi:hypothetical protein CAP36_09380 [Chitinophagaceae bacterium IBVUCB2]|nr:hypothetical protein CAP36_09380 [Chitinophagaceae bacterium IBVUCB2]
MATRKAKKVSAKKDAAGNLMDLFKDGIKDMYWAESAMIKALPKMAINATSPKLKKALRDHLKQTRGQVKRLNQVFATIDIKPQGKKCEAMAGLLREGDGIIEETQMGSVRDAAIIAAAQKSEHYEIASYGTLAAFAKVLGNRKAIQLLRANLAEEKKADTLLSSIADTALNSKADKEEN